MNLYIYIYIKLHFKFLFFKFNLKRIETKLVQPKFTEDDSKSQTKCGKVKTLCMGSSSPS